MSEEELIEKIEKIIKHFESQEYILNGQKIYEYIQGLLDLYNKEKEKNKKVRNKIEYYLIDNMSLENNPEKLRKEFIKLKELLED